MSDHFHFDFDETKAQAIRITANKKSSFDRFEDLTKQSAEFLGNLTKIIVVVSISVGFGLLLAFLRNENAPFPAIDSSIGAVITIIAAVFVFLTVVAASLFLIPAYSGLVSDPKILEQIHPTDNRPAYLSYGLLFGPFLAIEIFFIVAAFSSTFFPRWWLWLSLITSLIVLIWWFRRVRSKVHRLLNPTGFSLVWWLTIAQIALTIHPFLDSNASKTRAGLYGTLLLILVGTFHYLVVRSFASRKTLAIGYVLFFALLLTVYPGASCLGGMTLEWLGLGGDIPVSIIVRTIEPGASETRAVQISGCLVLGIGGDVLIRPTPRRTDCRLKPRSIFAYTQQTIAPYQDVERYARTDVLKIFGFPTQCGTVDGLPICAEDSKQQRSAKP